MPHNPETKNLVMVQKVVVLARPRKTKRYQGAWPQCHHHGNRTSPARRSQAVTQLLVGVMLSLKPRACLERPRELLHSWETHSSNTVT